MSKLFAHTTQEINCLYAYDDGLRAKTVTKNQNCEIYSNSMNIKSEMKDIFFTFAKSVCLETYKLSPISTEFAVLLFQNGKNFNKYIRCFRSAVF